MTDARRSRPLDGRTILVTRPAAQATPFVTLLEDEGARVLAAPTIAIDAPASWQSLDDALDRIEGFTWVIFTSVNGVAMVGRRLAERRETWEAIAHRRVAAIGPATAEALAREGVAVEIVPGEYRAEGLVERLVAVLDARDRVLLPRAAQTRDLLVRELARTGAHVEEIAVYVTRRVEDRGASIRTALASRGVDAVTFTSSSTVRNFAELLTEDERRAWLDDVVVASIGPITASTAAEYGWTTTVMPGEYTIPALARALTDYFAGASATRRR